MTAGLWTLLAVVVGGAILRLPLALVMFAGGASCGKGPISVSRISSGRKLMQVSAQLACIIAE